jgi:hypothetical protein
MWGEKRWPQGSWAEILKWRDVCFGIYPSGSLIRQSPAHLYVKSLQIKVRKRGKASSGLVELI